MKDVRVIAICQELDEAVARCTVLKAHLHGQKEELEDAIARGELSAGNDDESKKFDDDSQAFGYRVNEGARKKTAIRGQKKIFMQCLSDLSKQESRSGEGADARTDAGSNSGEDITIDRLTECLGEHGFNLEKLDEYLEKMKREGIIYEPRQGIIRYLEG